MNKETLTVERNKRGTVTYRNDSGERHNPHGPAVVYADGDKYHYINGELHNPDGPAVVFADDYKAYYINGQLHNPDGPAIAWADGSKSYFINGEELTQAEFKIWQAEQVAALTAGVK